MKTSPNLFFVLALALLLAPGLATAQTLTFDRNVTFTTSPAYTTTGANNNMGVFRYSASYLALAHKMANNDMNLSLFNNTYGYLGDIKSSMLGTGTYTTTQAWNWFNTGYIINYLTGGIGNMVKYKISDNFNYTSNLSNPASNYGYGAYYNSTNAHYIIPDGSTGTFIERDNDGVSLGQVINLDGLSYTFSNWFFDNAGNILLLPSGTGAMAGNITMWRYSYTTGSVSNFTNIKNFSLNAIYTSMFFDKQTNSVFLTNMSQNLNSTFTIYNLSGETAPPPNGYQVVHGVAFDTTACINNDYACVNATIQWQGYYTDDILGAIGYNATCNTDLQYCAAGCEELEYDSPASLVSYGYPWYYGASCSSPGPEGFQIVNNTAFSGTQCLDDSLFCLDSVVSNQAFQSMDPLGQYFATAYCNSEPTTCAAGCYEFTYDAPIQLSALGYDTYLGGVCYQEGNISINCPVVNATSCADVKHIDTCIQDSFGNTGWVNTDNCIAGSICRQNTAYNATCETITSVSGSSHYDVNFGADFYVWLARADLGKTLYSILLPPLAPILCLTSGSNVEDCVGSPVYADGQSYQFDYAPPGVGAAKGTGRITTSQSSQTLSAAYYIPGVTNTTYVSYQCDYKEMNIKPASYVTVPEHNTTQFTTGLAGTTPRSQIHYFSLNPDYVTYSDTNQYTIVTGTPLLNQTVLTLVVDTALNTITLYYGNSTDLEVSVIYSDAYVADVGASLTINEDLPTATYTVMMVPGRSDGSFTHYYSGVYPMENNVFPTLANVTVVSGAGDHDIIYSNKVRTEYDSYVVGAQNDEASYDCTYLKSGCYDYRMAVNYNPGPDYQDYADFYNCIAITGADEGSYDINTPDGGQAAQLNACSQVLGALCNSPAGTKLLYALFFLIGVLFVAGLIGIIYGFPGPALGVGVLIDALGVITAAVIGFIPAYVTVLMIVFAAGLIYVFFRRSAYGGGGE